MSTDNPPAAAVLYLRVSDESQTDGTSLESQLKACTERAASLGASIAGIFQDVQTARDYKARRGVQQALEYIETGKAKYLISFKLDRTGRNVDALRDIRHRVQKAGGEIIYADGMVFENSAVGNLLYTNLSGFAEFERELIKERTTKGRRARATAGRQPSTYMAPIGYHIVSKADVMAGGEYRQDQLGTYVVVPEQAKVVKKIFNLFTSGSSLRRVATTLTTSGIPAPRHARKWHPETVRGILSNPAYKGTAVYGRHSSEHDESRIERGMRAKVVRLNPDKAAWITIPCPRLVSDSTWELAQSRLSTNRALHSGRKDRKYLLTGILRCPTCGRGMVGITRGGKRWYEAKAAGMLDTMIAYGCNQAHARGECSDYRRYNVVATNEKIIKQILSVATNPAAIETSIRERNQQRKSAMAEDTAGELRRELASLSARESATRQAQVRAVMRGVDSTGYEDDLVGLATRRQTVEAELAKITAHRSGIVPDRRIPTLAAQIAASIEKLREIFLSPTVPANHKHDLILGLVERIVPDGAGGGFVVEWRNDL